MLLWKSAASVNISPALLSLLLMSMHTWDYRAVSVAIKGRGFVGHPPLHMVALKGMTWTQVSHNTVSCAWVAADLMHADGLGDYAWLIIRWHCC